MIRIRKADAGLPDFHENAAPGTPIDRPTIRIRVPG